MKVALPIGFTLVLFCSLIGSDKISANTKQCPPRQTRSSRAGKEDQTCDRCCCMVKSMKKNCHSLCFSIKVEPVTLSVDEICKNSVGELATLCEDAGVAQMPSADKVCRDGKATGALKTLCEAVAKTNGFRKIQPTIPSTAAICRNATGELKIICEEMRRAQMSETKFCIDSCRTKVMSKDSKQKKRISGLFDGRKQRIP